jgi:hypothetical protein
MKEKVHYEELRPASAKASLEKLKQDGYYVVGLEVTEPALQELVDVNIDPQHSGEKRTDTSAVDFSHKNFKSVLEKIKEPIAFVTSKADLDSIGAMAIFTMALEGRTDELSSTGFAARVSLINKFDNYKLEEKRTDKTLEQAIKDTRILGGIDTAVKDFKISVLERVKLIEEFLKTGEQPSKYVTEYDNTIEQIIQSCADGTTTIKLHEKGFTVVESPYMKAFDMGYTQSPLVVACNKKFDPRNTGTTQVKVTIGQHPSAQLIDFSKLIKDLNAVEPSYVEKENQWGGSSTIFGSPVKTGTLLDLEQIIDMVGDLMPTASDF